MNHNNDFKNLKGWIIYSTADRFQTYVTARFEFMIPMWLQVALNLMVLHFAY